MLRVIELRNVDNQLNPLLHSQQRRVEMTPKLNENDDCLDEQKRLLQFLF